MQNGIQNQDVTLDTIAVHTGEDPGLNAQTSQQDIDGGVAAARVMNEVIQEALDATGVNSDGVLTAEDLRILSDYIRANQALYDKFVEGHGDDENDEETGYHLVQGDGGTLQFQGRDFIDTIADAIYHLGFEYADGRFLNEDGNANEQVEDVAGWLNYYVNGVNIVYGSEDGETLHSGDYSGLLKDAASELFLAGAGDDKVWAGKGHDEVHGGAGDDVSGGGKGNDALYGEAGDDKLWGDEGADYLHGGAGKDVLGGGAGADTLIGAGGADQLSGQAGSDRLEGGGGDDKLWAGGGHDVVNAGAGNDVASGDKGRDTLNGGAGNDKLWGGDGKDILNGEAGKDTLGGGNGADTISGGGGADTVYGGDAGDLIDGGSGHDTLFGENGNDTLIGGHGNDMLTGGDGKDVFDGGTGADVLKDWEGEGSKDIFIFRAGDSGDTSGGYDVIKGFTAGEDKIDLTAFDGLAYVAEEFSADGAGEVTYDGTFVLIDADGDGLAEMAIEVKWAGEIGAGDFLL